MPPKALDTHTHTQTYWHITLSLLKNRYRPVIWVEIYWHGMFDLITTSATFHRFSFQVKEKNWVAQDVTQTLARQTIADIVVCVNRKEDKKHRRRCCFYSRILCDDVDQKVDPHYRHSHVNRRNNYRSCREERFIDTCHSHTIRPSFDGLLHTQWLSILRVI